MMNQKEMILLDVPRKRVKKRVYNDLDVLAKLYEPLEIENVENEDNLNNLRIKKRLKNKKLKYN